MPTLSSAASFVDADALGVVSKLTAGPAAVLRASRRTRRTAAFLATSATHVKSRLLPLTPGPAASLRRQGYNSFMAQNVCAINGFDVRVRGPIPHGPALLVCNHVTWQDPILINSVIPSSVVAKSEVGSWPLIGALTRGLEHLLVERGNVHSGASVLLRARQLLERGCNVLTFPEGTTSRGREILPFYRGVFGLAQLTGAPLIPMTLTHELGDAAAWVGDDSFLPNFAMTVARRRTISWLDLGAPIQLNPDESAEQLAARTRATMHTLLRARQAALATQGTFA
ncbi:lysophospholipid acyltransferase family protein [Enhygromyxa salina]|uniref:1-acyl-sn-glycerol-3-phosphate acyltransferase n=1 Tax=Enhygromyxa salina TaxID=215803 RepID=A0A2S9YUT1_9BACT|nr:lysophospholipid acyltransferase family protein [Enhygromyxa salina]PRQ08844.1 1-acyl-sn-glycerol-3-phosphate acyltransferase [Enhygromyxa salina]